MNILTRMLARRRLAKSLKPCPELRARRLAQMSPERAERYRRNMAAIQDEMGAVR